MNSLISFQSNKSKFQALNILVRRRDIGLVNLLAMSHGDAYEKWCVYNDIRRYISRFSAFCH